MANKKEKSHWAIVTETGAFEEWEEVEDGSSTPIKKKSLEEIIREAEEANKRNL